MHWVCALFSAATSMANGNLCLCASTRKIERCGKTVVTTPANNFALGGGGMTPTHVYYHSTRLECSPWCVHAEKRNIACIQFATRIYATLSICTQSAVTMAIGRAHGLTLTLLKFDICWFANIAICQCKMPSRKWHRFLVRVISFRRAYKYPFGLLRPPLCTLQLSYRLLTHFYFLPNTFQCYELNSMSWRRALGHDWMNKRHWRGRRSKMPFILNLE